MENSNSCHIFRLTCQKTLLHPHTQAFTSLKSFVSLTSFSGLFSTSTMTLDTCLTVSVHLLFYAAREF